MEDKTAQGEGVTSLSEMGRGDWYLKQSLKGGQGGEELGKSSSLLWCLCHQEQGLI